MQPSWDQKHANGNAAKVRIKDRKGVSITSRIVCYVADTFTIIRREWIKTTVTL